MQTENPARVFKAIRRIVRAIDLRSREVAKVSGLTIPQIVVLQAIRDLGKVTTKALSDHADLSSATVVTILDKLEEKELVGRYRSDTDRRIVHAFLTDRGVEVMAKVPGLLHEDFGRKFDQMSDEQRLVLVSSIEAIAEMLNAQDLDAAPILTTAGDLSGK
ncbi:MarR family winged helix-turn-helix transcriptional regulator [Roseibium suaedae]|uniref:DNA-binding transcriptional regulator, MarR family n=1 Tax=Roseibium suaedae TaxID=735517 RepID=A0A1M7KDE0_9HYPH|nr:MarR family transcriptional regulator [Roseibium suaedae]SHM63319.1 DNA-binding transcriptional regulator, MarR family [Roseibium suaedae]